jgi:hypothetical protein
MRRVHVSRPLCSLVIGALLMGAAASRSVHAQGRGGRGAGGAAPAASARATAQTDLTGYWVSVVTQHWHLRMTVPPRGEFAMLPLNAEARRIANTWDPARDQAAGNQCKSYGAANIMSVPGRLHIHWADDNTLQIDTDAGTQTRLLHFGKPAPGNLARQWQGYSVASWDSPGVRPGVGEVSQGSSDLKVTTTNMRAGYLRKNGVPYGENAKLEEYIDTFTEPNGDTWLIDTYIVTDPQYLTGPYVTTVQFLKVPDASGWDPTPCRADEPR